MLATFEKSLREECGYTGGLPYVSRSGEFYTSFYFIFAHSNSVTTSNRYWDWSLDASEDSDSTAIYDTEIFDPYIGFGGNGYYVEPTPEENPSNITGGTGGGCVMDGPFTEDKFSVNIPETSCLKRDYVPWIMNTFAHPSVVEHVTSQPDYTTFVRALENKPSFDEPNIHGSGHFGVGGVLGTIGNVNHSPGGELPYLAYPHEAKNK